MTDTSVQYFGNNPFGRHYTIGEKEREDYNGLLNYICPLDAMILIKALIIILVIIISLCQWKRQTIFSKWRLSHTDYNIIKKC